MNDLIKHENSDLNEIELVKQDLKNIKQFEEIKNNPVVKATIISILKSVPIFGELIDGTIDNLLNEFQRQKRTEFLNLIISGSNITSDMVNDVEFIMNFAKTLEAINRLESNDKIRYFANLLKNSYFTDDKIDNNDFFEFFECLNSISYKQIKILAILNTIENNPEPYIDKTISEKEHYVKRYWGSFKKELKDKLNIEDEDVYPLMKSLERTGLFTIHNGPSWSSPQFGQLTSYFKKFAKIVLDL